MSLPGKPKSLWIDTAPPTDFPKLEKDLKVDLAVVGGGMAGLNTAILAKRAGLKVAVLEMGRVGHGVSGHSTAKLSALHQLKYSQKILPGFGEQGARHYAEANQAGIEHIAELIKAYRIKCDFTREANYTFAETVGGLMKVKEEVKAASTAGLDAEFVQTPPLPFKNKGAVAVPDQAYFNPAKYAAGIAKAIDGDGSYVFEETPVLDVETKSGRVKTESASVTAKDVVIATNMPFLDRGLYFTKAHPHRSYCIAAKVTGKLPPGMYINAEDDIISILPYRSSDGDWLVVGGQGHKTGEVHDTEQKYRALEKIARKRFKVRSVTHRWSTQDGVSIDGVPFIGRLTPFSKHVYTATGFSKWGLAASMGAAIILTDLIQGKDNAWAKTFDSNRFKPLAGGMKFLSENFQTGFRYIKEHLDRSSVDVDSLREGDGAVGKVRGEKLAVYRDDSGQLHAVSPICTHLGCVVAFNRAEQTWDCPCHGSRFTTDGEVLHGPATEPLAKKRIL